MSTAINKVLTNINGQGLSDTDKAKARNNSGVTAALFTAAGQSSVVTDVKVTDAKSGTTIDNGMVDIPAFAGATASTAGKPGLVPAPASGSTSEVLYSDGTWKEPALHNPLSGTMSSRSPYACYIGVFTYPNGTSGRIALSVSAVLSDNNSHVIVAELSGGANLSTSVYATESITAATWKSDSIHLYYGPKTLNASDNTLSVPIYCIGTVLSGSPSNRGISYEINYMSSSGTWQHYGTACTDTTGLTKFYHSTVDYSAMLMKLTTNNAPGSGEWYKLAEVRLTDAADDALLYVTPASKTVDTGDANAYYVTVTSRGLNVDVINHGSPYTVTFGYATNSSDTKTVDIYANVNASRTLSVTSITGYEVKLMRTQVSSLPDTITYAANRTVAYDDVFGKATSANAGTSGLVPAPAAGNQDSVLTGSGTWSSDINVNAATANHLANPLTMEMGTYQTENEDNKSGWANILNITYTAVAGFQSGVNIIEISGRRIPFMICSMALKHQLTYAVDYFKYISTSGFLVEDESIGYTIENNSTYKYKEDGSKDGYDSVEYIVHLWINLNSNNRMNICVKTSSASGKITLGSTTDAWLTTPPENLQPLISFASTFTAATASAAGSIGLVPAPSAGTTSSYVLSADGNWTDIQASLSVFAGASSSADGSAGIVPQPKAGQNNYVLTGNGSWSQFAPNASYAANMVQNSVKVSKESLATTDNTLVLASLKVSASGKWETLHEISIAAAMTTRIQFKVLLSLRINASGTMTGNNSESRGYIYGDIDYSNVSCFKFVSTGNATDGYKILLLYKVNKTKDKDTDMVFTQTSTRHYNLFTPVSDSDGYAPIYNASEYTVCDTLEFTSFFRSPTYTLTSATLGGVGTPVYVKDGMITACTVDTKATKDSTNLITSDAVYSLTNNTVHLTGDETLTSGYKNFQSLQATSYESEGDGAGIDLSYSTKKPGVDIPGWINYPSKDCVITAHPNNVPQADSAEEPYTSYWNAVEKDATLFGHLAASRYSDGYKGGIYYTRGYVKTDGTIGTLGGWALSIDHSGTVKLNGTADEATLARGVMDSEHWGYNNIYFAGLHMGGLGHGEGIVSPSGSTTSLSTKYLVSMYLDSDETVHYVPVDVSKVTVGDGYKISIGTYVEDANTICMM